MGREELIKAIRDLAGGKMVFDEQWTGKVSVGEDRPVCGLTKKFIYMDCQCYVKPVWENDGTLVNVIRRIPVMKPVYGKVTGKVELDSLCTRDLESVYDGVVEYFHWQMNRIPELQKQLEACMKFQTKYDKVMKKK